MKYLLGLVASLALVFSVSAEIRQDRYQVVARTNATFSVQVNGLAAGKLQRIRLDVSGAGKTNLLQIVDADGSVILSNEYTSGTTYVSFTNNPVPFVGMDISTSAANTTAVTNTLIVTFER